MSLPEAYQIFESAREEALAWFTQELGGLRTGRVKPDIVSNIQIEHYGARTPLQGVASVSLSDARTIVISPWDRTAVPAIEKALSEANLGAMPAVDGQVLRLSFPLMSTERREETIKQLHKKAEEARVRMRKGRDEGLSMIKKDKENSAITEDDFYEGKEKLDNLIGKANDQIADMVTKKEEEIRKV
jgi:ribosome recycling factor